MNSEKTMVFSEDRCRIILSGMVDSIKHLVEYAKSEQGRNFHWGYINSAIILAAHTAELLLKYKIEREGKPFEKDPQHRLYKLYTSLNNESKIRIQEEFDKLLSEANMSSDMLPDGWNSAESVFRSANRAYVDWRYLVETNPTKPRQSPDIDMNALYMAVLSVFRTTPLKDSVNTFETIPVEEIPDPDVRERALSYVHGEDA